MGKTSLMPVVLEFQDDKDHSDWLHQIRTFLPQSLMLGMSCSYYETQYIPSEKKDGNVKSPFLHSIPIQS